MHTWVGRQLKCETWMFLLQCVQVRLLWTGFDVGHLDRLPALDPHDQTWIWENTDCDAPEGFARFLKGPFLKVDFLAPSAVM